MAERIEAGTDELRRGFWQLTQGHPTSQSLRLFYAVECGLKSVYLRRNQLRTTGQIQDPGLQERGHDIARWVKELRLPASIASKGPTFRLKREKAKRGHSTHVIEVAHQAWRYGVQMEESDESTLLEYLRKIHNWVEGEFVR